MQIFPEFKRLEWSNRKVVKQFTAEFLSSSDFNFLSFWSKHISEKMRLSPLNKNPLVLFHDYVSETGIFSFGKIILTLSKLFCWGTNFKVNIHPHNITGECEIPLHHLRFEVVAEEIRNKSKRKGREPP